MGGAKTSQARGVVGARLAVSVPETVSECWHSSSSCEEACVSQWPTAVDSAARSCACVLHPPLSLSREVLLLHFLSNISTLNACQQAGPSFAVLPEGFSSPQGSNTASLEAKLDALIEQRTGKAEALPELTEVPQVRQGVVCWLVWLLVVVGCCTC